MNRITRDEFIEWIKQNFPNNVDIEFRRTWRDAHFGRWIEHQEQMYLDNIALNTIRFSDEP